MATCTTTTNLVLNITSCTNTSNNGSFLPRSKINWPPLRFASTRIEKSPNTNLLLRKATPEAAGDVVTSLTGLSQLPAGDYPWLAGIAGLLVTIPLMVQRLLTLTKEVDMAAQTVEKIADAVGKVANEVDKAAEDIGKALPEGSLKKVVTFVEDLAEETAKDAQKVEDLMDKVEELDDKLEEFLNNKFKGTDKA